MLYEFYENGVSSCPYQILLAVRETVAVNSRFVDMAFGCFIQEPIEMLFGRIGSIRFSMTSMKYQKDFYLIFTSFQKSFK